MLLYACSLLVGTAYAQQRTITGTVKGEDGAGLPGVNIVVKGTAQGTTSNIDGRFRLEVPGNEAVLLFSYIGYLSKEMTVGSQTEISISLEPDATELQEVVVTAVGIARENARWVIRWRRSKVKVW